MAKRFLESTFVYGRKKVGHVGHVQHDLPLRRPTGAKIYGSGGPQRGRVGRYPPKKSKPSGTKLSTTRPLCEQGKIFIGRPISKPGTVRRGLFNRPGARWVRPPL